MEQILGEHVEPEPIDLGAFRLRLRIRVHVAHIPITQNRAYAASQLVDLSEKLAKASGSVSQTRAPIPQLPKDEKANAATKVHLR